LTPASNASEKTNNVCVTASNGMGLEMQTIIFNLMKRAQQEDWIGRSKGEIKVQEFPADIPLPVHRKRSRVPRNVSHFRL
jgi:hypothetical protein